MAETRPRERPPRARRALLVFLAMSAAAHALVFGVLPAFTRDSGPEQATRLEVTILEPRPLSVAPPEPAPQLRPQVRPKAQHPAAEVEPKPRDEAPVPVLALPEPRTDERRSFSVGAALPEAEPAAAAAPEQKTQVASAASPPGFNAAYLRNPAPRYPVAARRAGEQGTVTLRVLVTRDGLASRVEVEQSSGSPHLDAAAREAVRAWRFTPARQGADAVESWVLVPIVFRLEGPG